MEESRETCFTYKQTSFQNLENVIYSKAETKNENYKMLLRKRPAKSTTFHTVNQF